PQDSQILRLKSLAFLTRFRKPLTTVFFFN
ncbi:MAG: hypothetical protein ACJAUV_001936, partial [Flavobacteriales bacterium]